MKEKILLGNIEFDLNEDENKLELKSVRGKIVITFEGESDKHHFLDSIIDKPYYSVDSTNKRTKKQ